MIRSVLIGTGSALPAKCVSNDELAQRVDTSDEWIRERTGIAFRYVAGEGETTGSLATAAARRALEAAGLTGADIATAAHQAMALASRVVQERGALVRSIFT